MRIEALRRTAALVLAVESLLIASAGHCSPSACDPDRATVDKAIKLRDQRRLSDAENLLKGVLQKNGRNIGASYILGTVELDRGGSAAEDGLRRLVETEKLLSAQDNACAIQLGWYSIYNTIGAQYYRRSNTRQAEVYLLKGYSHLGEMPTSTRQLLLSNLGLLYFNDGDFDKSLTYYKQAARLGSKNAANRAAAIERLQTAR